MKCVCEVKLPGFDMNKCHQIVDYMVDLRNVFDVRFVFGIMTTYDQWRVFWFDDSHDVAKITEVKSYHEHCAVNSASDYAIEKKVTVFATPVYERTDKNLASVLLSVLYKAAHSPVSLPKSLLDRRKRYVVADNSSFSI